MKPLYIMGVAGLAFVVGALVCRGDRTGEAAQRSADSLAGVVDSLTVRDRQRDADSIKAHRRLALIAEQNRLLVIKGHRGQHTVDSLKSLVVGTASVVPRPLYDSTIVAYQGLVQTREAERDSAEAKAIIWQRLYAGADSSRNAWRAIAVSAQSQLGAALKRAKWGCVLGAGASLGYGFVGDRPGVGTVAGVTVSCGKRV